MGSGFLQLKKEVKKDPDTVAHHMVIWAARGRRELNPPREALAGTDVSGLIGSRSGSWAVVRGAASKMAIDACKLTNNSA